MSSVTKNAEEANKVVKHSEAGKIVKTIGSDVRSETKHISSKVVKTSESFSKLQTASQILKSSSSESAKRETEKVLKSSSSDSTKKATTKVIKSSSSESAKKEDNKNIIKNEIKSTKTAQKAKKETAETKLVNGNTVEDKKDTAIYSEVDKSKKRSKQTEVKQQKEVKHEKTTAKVKIENRTVQLYILYCTYT